MQKFLRKHAIWEFSGIFWYDLQILQFIGKLCDDIPDNPDNSVSFQDNLRGDHLSSYIRQNSCRTFLALSYILQNWVKTVSRLSYTVCMTGHYRSSLKTKTAHSTARLVGLISNGP